MAPAAGTLTQRSAREVLDDHLRLRAEGDFEGDLARNYAPHVRILSGTGVHYGHAGVRDCERDLHRYFPDLTFEITLQLVDVDLAYIEWCARGGGRESNDGADSFVIRDGKIVAQTIHYQVKR